jgi:hypothetical protein
MVPGLNGSNMILDSQPPSHDSDIRVMSLELIMNFQSSEFLSPTLSVSMPPVPGNTVMDSMLESMMSLATDSVTWKADNDDDSRGGVEVIPKMFNIRNSQTVMVHARDSQLHQDYTLGLGNSILFPSQDGCTSVSIQRLGQNSEQFPFDSCST